MSNQTEDIKNHEEVQSSNEPIDVKQVLMVATHQLAVIAWQKMGLQPDFITNKIHKDISQAKLAIDAANALSEVYLDKLDDAEKNALQSLLKDLKLNFVQQQN